MPTPLPKKPMPFRRLLLLSSPDAHFSASRQQQTTLPLWSASDMSVSSTHGYAPPLSTMNTKAVKAVIIRPNGDVEMNHLARFADKYILPTDPIFVDSLPTEMSVLLELPLLAQRLNPRDDVPGDTYHKNRPATFLQMRPCSGFASLDWQRKIGAVLVVRMDRKPLSCLHLEAIWRYHWTLMSDVNSIAWQTDRKKNITRKAFELFWNEFRKRQVEAGREDFENLVSPYEM